MHLPTARHATVPRRGSAPLCGALVLAAVLTGCDEPERSVAPIKPSLTVGSGVHLTTLGRTTFAERLHVRRKTDGWAIDIKTKDATDVIVQSITFQPGGHSGWHRHPGPAVIQVVSGTLTFYESDDPACTPDVFTAGQATLDAGDHAHIARNESDTPAQVVVTYFAPPGAALRIDAPAPPQCDF